MSKHTPAPWNRQAINRLLRFGRKNSGSWDDVDIWPEDDSMSMPDENDTNLIAAAPELLEALEALLNGHTIIEHEALGYLTSTLWDNARKAVAKAKGE